MTGSQAHTTELPKGGPLSALFVRKNILAVYLFAVGLNSLVFYWAPSGFYDRNVNLLFSLACFALTPLTRWERLFVPLVHASTWLGLSLVVYVASHSGGVNSTVLVWLTLLALPVLMLRGAAAAFGTIAWVLVILLGLFASTEQGWISSHAQVSPQAVPWSLMQNTTSVSMVPEDPPWQPLGWAICSQAYLEGFWPPIIQSGMPAAWRLPGTVWPATARSTKVAHRF